MTCSRPVVVLFVLVAAPGMLRAQGEPLGPEFRVNTYTTDGQLGSSIARDAIGNFVVVWVSMTQDGSAGGIFGQRYASTGGPLGGEFRVNTYTPNHQGPAYVASDDQRGPAIASDSAGDFIIVWESRLQDGGLGGVFGQRYSSSGTPLGAEFRINTATAFDQYNPSVASDPDGNLVVAWIGQNPSFLDIFAQRYSSSGVPLGGPSRVNTYITGNQIFPFVSTDPAGNYVVTWTSAGSPAQDGSGPGIFAQRYNMILP
jgi:hypothetical protein